MSAAEPSKKAVESIQISVVIPAFNEEKRIGRCLRSLMNQRTNRSFEILVVDSSTDGTAELVAREFPSVRLIHRGEQTPPAEARNLGIAASRGNVVAFIDSDCRADPGWIETIARAQDNRYLAVGGSVALDRPATIFGAALFAIEFSEYGRGSPRRNIRWLPSCNLSVKREALQRYGPFPTHMVASEDMLFARRLLTESGIPLQFEPAMRVAHSNRNTAREFRDKLRHLGYWSGFSRGSGIVPGGVLMRFRAAIPLLVPYRLLTTVVRLLTRSRDLRLIGVAFLLWPLLLYGLIHWCICFERGIRAARSAESAL